MHPKPARHVTHAAAFGAAALALASNAAAQSNAATTAAASPAVPPPPPRAAAARPAPPNEPTAAQVTSVALRYFRVHPEALDGLRAAAQARALMPTLSASYRFDDLRFLQQENAQGFQPRQTSTLWNQQNNNATVALSWDLRDAVFNPDSVQVYGLVGVQRDIMLEVTRTYFARRQLLLRLQYGPSEDPVAREATALRVEEFTAQLDVLTGGWFSRSIAVRARAAGGG